MNTVLKRVAADGTQLACASHLATHRSHFTHELALSEGRVVHVKTGAFRSLADLRALVSRELGVSV